VEPGVKVRDAGQAKSEPLAAYVIAVDCHAHVMRRDAPLASDRHSAPKRDCTVEEYLAVLDTHGISHGVLTAPSFYGTDNSLLLDALDRAGGRVRGTVIVDPDIDRASLAKVLPAIRESGAKVVVDHFGSPDPGQGVACGGFKAVLDGVRAGDTWVKLSAPYRQGGADPCRYVDALLDAGGPQQLVWASDWPFVLHEDDVTYRDCVQWLVDWVPNEAVRRIILADTPASLFGFDRALPTRTKERRTEETSP
jgi:predicted TIM-barrel fold metal-dependent hydrolase